jgi:hypothetical protein
MQPADRVNIYTNTGQDGGDKYVWNGQGCIRDTTLQAWGYIGTGDNKPKMSSYKMIPGTGSGCLKVFTNGDCTGTVPGVSNQMTSTRADLPSAYNDKVRSVLFSTECFQNETSNFNNNNISKNESSNKSKNNNIYLFLLFILIIIAFYFITKK